MSDIDVEDHVLTLIRQVDSKWIWPRRMLAVVMSSTAWLFILFMVILILVALYTQVTTDVGKLLPLVLSTFAVTISFLATLDRSREGGLSAHTFFLIKKDTTEADKALILALLKMKNKLSLTMKLETVYFMNKELFTEKNLAETMLS